MAETRDRTRTPAGPAIVFWLAVAIHTLDIFQGRLTTTPSIPSTLFLVLYVFLGVYAYFAFKSANRELGYSKPGEHTVEQFFLFLTLGILAYAVPLLGNYLGARWISPGGVLTVASILVFAPVWIIFFVFFAQDYLDRHLAGILAKGLIIFWVFWVIWATLPAMQTVTNPLLQEGSTATVSPGDVAKNFWTATIKTYNKLMNNAKADVQKQIAYATGDVYTARVDANSNLQLGVTLDNLQPTQTKFKTSDTIGAFTTLKAETIDAPLTVGVTCIARNSDNSIVDAKNVHVTPDTSTKKLDIRAAETQDIDCEVAPDTLKAGKATITIGTEFDMQTLSYLKTYVMDKQRLRELRDAKIDPFQQYGITDRNPVAVYTSGPVSVAMGFGTPPVGIDREQDEFTGILGITLQNQWPGTINAVQDVTILVPKGFTITDITTGEQIKQGDCTKVTTQDWCDESVSNIYTITPNFGKIEQNGAATIRARISIHRPDYDGVLGATPINTKYFKAVADYTYALEKATTLIIDTPSTQDTTDCQGVDAVTPNPDVLIQPTEANITFTTTQTVSTEVRYCLGSSVASCVPQVVNSPNAALKHNLHLDGLTPNALYAYEVNGYCGNRIKFYEGTFTTLGTQ